MQSFSSVDEYVSQFPAEVKDILQKIRSIVKENAPDAMESISYQMPEFKLHGKPLVYFAAWKQHIGFYATPAGNEAFKKELSVYKGAKGSVQFPLNKPMPYELIKDMVVFRVKELSMV